MYAAYHHSLTGSRVGWPESAALAASVGFPACDIWLEKAMAAGVQSTRDTLHRFGLRTSTVDMPVDFRSSEDAFKAGFSELENMAQFAVAIGCPRMQARVDPSGPLPKPEWRTLQLRRLRAIVEVLQSHGVRLALEFVGSADIRRLQPYEFIWRMNEMLEFVQDVGPNAGLLLDSWHWHHAGATADDILKAGRDGIIHVHLNDAPAQPFDQVVDKERLMPGEGVIDLPGFLGALRQIGYDGAVSVEVFAKSLQTIAPEEGAKLGFETTMKAFRQAGVA